MLIVYLDDKGTENSSKELQPLTFCGRSFAINYHLCTDSSDLTRNRPGLIRKKTVIIIFGTLFTFFPRCGVNLSREEEKNICGAYTLIGQ